MVIAHLAIWRVGGIRLCLSFGSSGYQSVRQIDPRLQNCSGSQIVGSRTQMRSQITCCVVDGHEYNEQYVYELVAMVCHCSLYFTFRSFTCGMDTKYQASQRCCGASLSCTALLPGRRFRFYRPDKTPFPSPTELTTAVLRPVESRPSGQGHLSPPSTLSAATQMQGRCWVYACGQI